VGQWYGRGAELLGLKGKVDTKRFDALRQGLDSETGEFLRQRRGADRVGADGKKLSRARSLYDFTISAPKSVSVMAILGGDTRLVRVHYAAVKETLEEIERQAASRVRRGGANANRITGSLISGCVPSRYQPRTRPTAP
jgi:conjugative relaxase-like TrwC/TraI family protein